MIDAADVVRALRDLTPIELHAFVRGAADCRDDCADPARAALWQAFACLGADVEAAQRQEARALDALLGYA